MNPRLHSVYWLAPLLALVLPPFLLVPLANHLAGAQFFKDIYEACLWLSPAVGVLVLVVLIRRRRREPAVLRSAPGLAALSLALMDLVSPIFFYVLLALLAGGH